MAKHDVKMILKARDDASKKFNKVSKSAGGLTKILRRAAVAAAAYFSLRAITRFASGSIAAHKQQETAVNHLQAALANLNKESQLADMQSFASEIQKVTTIGDEATLEIMALGSNIAGLGGKDLKAATTAAIGFSKALGIDTASAMKLVAKAAAGETTAFSRYGIVFEKGMSKHDQYQQILAKGADGFKIAAAETDTYAGVTQQLSNSWGDAKEKVGKYLASMPGLQKGMKITQVLIENFGLAWDIAWTKTKLKLIDFKEDFKYTFSTVIPQLLQWFGRNWKEVFIDLFNMTKTVFVNMAKNIGAFFKAIWGWMKGDGWEFSWTPLTEGFKSALKEMPDIAKRGLTDTEIALSERLGAMTEKMSVAIAEKFKPADVETMLAGVMDGAAGASGAAAAKKTGALSAQKNGATTVQTRFLTMFGGRGGDPAVKTEKNTASAVNVLQRIEKGIDKLTSPHGFTPPGGSTTIASLS